MLTNTTVSDTLKLCHFNDFLKCSLCSGYLIDATTINKCLHAFCRSCIVKHLKNHSFCPVCKLDLLETQKWSTLRRDAKLQSIVYKMVPGLLFNEINSRSSFSEFCCQLDDKISILLKFTTSSQKTSTATSSADTRETRDEHRYLLCPAVFPIASLKKFIRRKYDLTSTYKVDIVFEDDVLDDDLKLLDIVYIYSAKQPIPLFYKISPFKAQKLNSKSAKSKIQMDINKRSSSSSNRINSPNQLSNVKNSSQGEKRRVSPNPKNLSSSPSTLTASSTPDKQIGNSNDPRPAKVAKLSKNIMTQHTDHLAVRKPCKPDVNNHRINCVTPTNNQNTSMKITTAPIKEHHESTNSNASSNSSGSAVMRSPQVSSPLSTCISSTTSTSSPSFPPSSLSSSFFTSTLNSSITTKASSNASLPAPTVSSSNRISPHQLSNAKNSSQGEKRRVSPNPNNLSPAPSTSTASSTSDKQIGNSNDPRTAKVSKSPKNIMSQHADQLAAQKHVDNHKTNCVVPTSNQNTSMKITTAPIKAHHESTNFSAPTNSSGSSVMKNSHESSPLVASIPSTTSTSSPSISASSSSFFTTTLNSSSSSSTTTTTASSSSASLPTSSSASSSSSNRISPNQLNNIKSSSHDDKRPALPRPNWSSSSSCTSDKPNGNSNDSRPPTVSKCSKFILSHHIDHLAAQKHGKSDVDNHKIHCVTTTNNQNTSMKITTAPVKAHHEPTNFNAQSNSSGSSIMKSSQVSSPLSTCIPSTTSTSPPIPSSFFTTSLNSSVTTTASTSTASSSNRINSPNQLSTLKNLSQGEKRRVSPNPNNLSSSPSTSDKQIGNSNDPRPAKVAKLSKNIMTQHTDHLAVRKPCKPDINNHRINCVTPTNNQNTSMKITTAPIKAHHESNNFSAPSNSSGSSVMKSPQGSPPLSTCIPSSINKYASSGFTYRPMDQLPIDLSDNRKSTMAHISPGSFSPIAGSASPFSFVPTLQSNNFVNGKSLTISDGQRPKDLKSKGFYAETLIN